MVLRFSLIAQFAHACVPPIATVISTRIALLRVFGNSSPAVRVPDRHTRSCGGEDLHATEIVSDTLDYHYARRAGGTAELRAVELSR